MLPFEKYVPAEMKRFGDKNWDRDAYNKMLDLCRTVDFKEHSDMASLFHPLLNAFNDKVVEICDPYERLCGTVSSLNRNRGIKRYPMYADWHDIKRLDNSLSRLVRAIENLQTDYPGLIQALLLEVDLSTVRRNGP